MNSQKIEELEATIAKAQQQIEDLKKPKTDRFAPEQDDDFFYVGGSGDPLELPYYNDAFDVDAHDFFNCYETKELAEKAAPLMRRSNAIIMAKLMVDPAFKPDWSDTCQVKYYVIWNGDLNKWTTASSSRINMNVACVSTRENAEQMCDLLTDWGVR